MRTLRGRMRQPLRTSSVPMTAIGTTGAPVCSARRPTPLRGAPSGPGRTRVPSGKSTTQSPAREDRAGGLHRLRVARAAIDGEGAEAVQQPCHHAVLEQLALCHVVDGPAHERADHERIEEAAVVGGQQQRAAARQVLCADALHAEVDQEERHEHRPDGPVEDGVDAALEAALTEVVKAGLFVLGAGVAHTTDTPSPTAPLQFRGVLAADRAGVAQLVERLSCKQGVRGSSPLSGLTMFSLGDSRKAG